MTKLQPSAAQKRLPVTQPAGDGAWYDPFPFAAVRVPLLPVEVYRQLANGAGTSEQHSSLASLAIAIGSPQLFDALTRANRDDAEHVRQKFDRYLIRMSTRSTPYGAFAGVGLLRWALRTDLSLSPELPRFRTRPDIGWLYSIIRSVETHPELRTQLRFRTNTAVRERGGRFLLLERANGSFSAGAGNVSIRASRAAKLVLDAATSSVAYADLAALVGREINGSTPKKIDTLLRELWEQTFLLSTLRPPLTGVDPAAYVLNQLRGVPGAGYFRKCLEDIIEACALWDATGAAEPNAALHYRALLEKARAVSAAAADSPLQTDMASPLLCSDVSIEIGRAAARAAELLIRLSPWPSYVPALASYRQAFTAKYGVNREVPLLDLLNPQIGLGLPNYNNGMASPDPQRAAERSKLLMDLALGAIRDRQHSIELDEKAIASLQTWTRDTDAIPQSLDLFLSVAATSAEAIDRGEFEIVVGPNVGSDTAGKSLGRFADILGADAANALSLVAEAEIDSAVGGLHAELSYVPQSLRAANVTVRPASRSYEIAVDLPSSLDTEHTIYLKDLLIGIENDRFYIRSMHLGARIYPYQGHMLNSMRAPAACRFLIDIARDGTAQLANFDWGPATPFTFLPRVVSGRIVLRVAQWKIDGAIAQVLRSAQTSEEFQKALDPWQAKWRLPQYVYLTAGDNRLLIDLHDPAQLEQIRREVRAGTVAPTLLLDEVYPSIDQAWLRAPNGRHLPEFVVSLNRRGASRAASLPAQSIILATPSLEYPGNERLRPPGSEWLMIKLYAPPAVHDQLLATNLYPFCETVLSKSFADSWFFIRYADPEPHLRLRFRGEPEILMRSLYPETCRWAGSMMQGGLISKFVFDTYERELERYGGISATALAESMFAADSAATCRMLQLLNTKALRLDKTVVALVSVDELLDGLGLGESGRLEWLRNRTRSKLDLGTEYRTRKELFRLAIGAHEYLRSQFGGAAFQRTLDERRTAFAAIAVGLQESHARNVHQEKLAEIYASYVHMHFNRLQGSDAYGELRLLTLLRRTRESLKHASPTPRFTVP